MYVAIEIMASHWDKVRRLVLRGDIRVLNNSNDASKGCGEYGVELCSPDQAMLLLHNPTFNNYKQIQKILSKCSSAWLEEFLEEGALDAMFTALR